MGFSRAPQTHARPFDLVVCGLLAGGLLLHLLLVPARGYERDIYSFGTWMRAAVEHGVVRVSEIVPCDYPPGYLYLLKTVGVLWTVVTGGPLPPDGTLTLRFLVKIVPILADLASGWVLYRIARPRLSRRAALALLVAVACNPALLFGSAVWGQADSIIALLTLLAVWSLSNRRSVFAFGAAAGAVLVKFQIIVLIPVLLLGAFVLERGKGVRDALKSSAGVAFVLLLPFYWTHRVDAVLSSAFGAVGRYPFISMHAHNLWWLVGGTQSPVISDAMRVGNAALTYHDLGFIMLGVATFLILCRLWRDLGQASGDPGAALFEAAALELMAFYLFPTQMHERYILPAIPLLAAVCVWKPRAWWLFGTVTLATLVSSASTLHAVYPESLGPLGSLLPAGRQETFAVSGIFLVAFFVLLLWTSDRRFIALVPAVIGTAAAVVAVAVLVPLTSSQRLSDWEPVQKDQSWGEVHRDRTVEGNRLSVVGFIFRHGLGTHAASHLTYHLNGAFRVLDTAFAIDDEANRGQSIRFRVLVDGEVRFDSGSVSGIAFPRHTRVPVEGAEFLTLEVLDGGDGINSDHADWLEPMLFR